MVDNIAITSGASAAYAAATDDVGGVHYVKNKLSYGANDAATLVSDSSPFPTRRVPKIVAATAPMTRPADITAYTAGDLVANSTTAASVAAFSIPIATAIDVAGEVGRCTLQKSGTVITNAVFRVHLFNINPVAVAPAGGDNAAYVPANKAGYLGSLDVTIDQVFGDGAWGQGVPTLNAGVPFAPATGTTTLFALIEARSGYTPISAEVFTLGLAIR